MGSFNGTCGLTGVSVREGDQVVAMVLSYVDKVHDATKNVPYPMYGLLLRALPFSGTYTDYGLVLPNTDPGYADPCIAGVPDYASDEDLTVTRILNALDEHEDDDCPPFVWMAHRAAFHHVMEADCYSATFSNKGQLESLVKGGQDLASAVADIMQNPHAQDPLKRFKAFWDLTSAPNALDNSLLYAAHFSHILPKPLSLLESIATHAGCVGLDKQELTSVLRNAGLSMAKTLYFERVAERLNIRITPQAGAGSQADNAALRVPYLLAMRDVALSLVKQRNG